jgi:glycosyltransferase involved in cell wall biosynthesis
MIHLSDGDPFGLMVVEAMMRGVPVIAPPTGGPREIIRDGIDGFLIEPTDTRALATAVLSLAGDPTRRGDMGSAGRARALELFDERRTAAEMWNKVADWATVTTRG